ncbi:MAG: hypothetical protein ACR2NI_01025, partial [Pirellulales bacterium]
PHLREALRSPADLWTKRYSLSSTGSPSPAYHPSDTHSSSHSYTTTQIAFDGMPKETIRM